MENYFDLEKAIRKYPPTAGVVYLAVFYERNGSYDQFRVTPCERNIHDLIINMIFSYKSETTKLKDNVYRRTIKVVQGKHIHYIHDYFVIADCFEKVCMLAKNYIDITQAREIK